MQNNWRQKSLEILERKIWSPLDPDEGSHLITTCHALRKKPVGEFGVEDLRVMIGQDIGLEYLVPLALEVLEADILAEGDLFEGDLLNAVLHCDAVYWRSNREQWDAVCALFRKKRDLLEAFDTTWEIRKRWRDGFRVFESIFDRSETVDYCHKKRNPGALRPGSCTKQQ